MERINVKLDPTIMGPEDVRRCFPMCTYIHIVVLFSFTYKGRSTLLPFHILVLRGRAYYCKYIFVE